MIARRWLLCLSLGMLVLFGAGVVGGETVEQRSAGEIPQLEDAPDPDATVTRIDLRPDGTAVWSLTVRMRLDSNESVEGFEAFEEEFEANRSQYLGEFRERMTGVVGNAETATDRQMTATAFDSEIGIEEVPRRWGYVTYQFRWEGFAAADDDVAVGDVFRGGLFLEDDDILIIESPSGYESVTVDPAPDETGDGQLQWNGPVSFDDRRPQVRFVPADSQSGSDDSSAGMAMPLLAGSIAVVVVGLAAVYTLRRDDDAILTADSDQPTAADTDPTPSEATATATAEQQSLEIGELATDEDRVLALLETEAGRMRQAEIADRLDWSASKTSRVISELAANDAVEKLRIGRENVIDLPDDAADSDP